MTFSKYPSNIDDAASIPEAIDNVTPVNAEIINRLRDGIIAIEQELGVLPSSTFGTVRARLDALAQTVNSLEIGTGSTTTALQIKLDNHIANTSNPHNVTLAQLGGVAAVTSVDEAVVRFDGTSGQVQNSANGPFVDDSGRVRLSETTDPTNISDNGFVYTKDVSGVTELFYMDSSGNINQITSLGGTGVSGTGTDNNIVRWDGTNDVQDSNILIEDTGQLKLLNNISIAGENNAGGSYLDMIKVGTSDEISIGGTSVSRVDLNANGNLGLRATDSLTSITGFLEVNSTTGTTTFPTIGSIRLKGGTNVSGIYFKSVAGFNVALATQDTADNIIYGTTTAGAMTNMYLDVPSTRSVRLRTGGVVRVDLSTSKFTLTNQNIFSWGDNGSDKNITIDTTTSATGKSLTISAQSSTGAGSTGGDLILSPGTGTSNDGIITATHSIEINSSASTVASQGTIRMPLASSMYTRNAANNNNLQVFSTDGANNIFIGSSSGDNGLYLSSAFAVRIRNGTTIKLIVDSSTTEIVDPVEANTTAGAVPSSGSLRIPSGNTNGLYSTWISNDIHLISVNAGYSSIGSTNAVLNGTLIDSPNNTPIILRNGNNGTIRVTKDYFQFENQVTATIQVEESSAGNGNNLTLLAGPAFTGDGGDGGDLILEPGSPDGSGANGQITLNDADSNEIASVNEEGLGLTERSSDPSSITAGKGYLYPKDDDGITSIYWADDVGQRTGIVRYNAINAYLNVLDFGAVPGVTGGGNAIQDAMDVMIADPEKYLGIIIPPGDYSITQPLFAIDRSGGSFCNVKLFGANPSFSVSASHLGQVLIRLEGDGYQDWPVMIVQGGRSCYFEGIIFLNTGNSAPKNVIDSGTGGLFTNPDLSDWVDPGTRTNRSSPHCCVAIDPFVDGYPDLDINNAYPGLEGYYGGAELPTVPNGSSNTVFLNCTFRGGYIGVASSPPGPAGGSVDAIQNNENNIYENCYWSYNTYHYACGQSQERNNILNNVRMYGCWAAITTEVVGPGGNASVPPFVNGGNIGGCRYLFDINASQRTYVSNLYLESTASLGKLGTGAAGIQGGIHLDGITCSFSTPDTTGVSTSPNIPFHLQTFGMVTIENSAFSTNGGEGQFFRIFNGGGRFNLREVTWGNKGAPDTGHVGIGVHDLDTLRGTTLQSYNPNIGAIYHDDPQTYFETSDLEGNPIVQAIQVSGDSSEGTISLSSTAGLEIGDLLHLRTGSPTSYKPQVLASGEFAYTYVGPIGIISDITIDTSISVSHLPYEFPFNSNIRLTRSRFLNYDITTAPSLNLSFYMDASFDVYEADGTAAEDTDLVSLWVSGAQTTRELEQSNSSLRPTYIEDVTEFNHQPGILFSDGYHLEYTGAKSNTNNLHNGNGASVTICFNYDSANPGTLFSTFDGSASSIGIELAVDGAGSFITKIGNGSGSYLVNSTLTAGTLLDGYGYVATVSHSTSGTPQYDVRINSTSEDSGSYTGSASSSDSSGILTVGARSDGTNGFESHILAVVISNIRVADSVIDGPEERLLRRIGQ